MDKPKILCVAGPTASGKTAYAISLAQKNNGEVVSCDSMQIYRYMNIGTAKPTKEEMGGIPHHLIDYVDPRTNYSVADYVKDARECIADVLKRGKMPIVCGGTGLYLDCLINQIEFSEDKTDLEYRNELEVMAEKEGVMVVHEMLKKVDKEAADTIHPNNLKRVIRALEIIKATGMTKTDADKNARKEPVYDATIYGMDMERERLYERINKRVDLMMEMGLLREAEELLKMGIPKESTAMQAIGYKELVGYFDGKISLDEAVETIKRESRRYAKRQITWLRRNPDIVWIKR